MLGNVQWTVNSTVTVDLGMHVICFTSSLECSVLRISGVAIFNSVKHKGWSDYKLDPQQMRSTCLLSMRDKLCCDHRQSQTIKESSCCLLLFLLVLPDRSDDPSLLCGGAVGWRDADRRMWGKRGACRVCPGQEGYSLLSAGGDGSAGPRLLPQLGSTSSRSVRETQWTLQHLCCHFSSLFLILTEILNSGFKNNVWFQPLLPKNLIKVNHVQSAKWNEQINVYHATTMLSPLTNKTLQRLKTTEWAQNKLKRICELRF